MENENKLKVLLRLYKFCLWPKKHPVFKHTRKRSLDDIKWGKKSFLFPPELKYLYITQMSTDKSLND